MQLSDTVTLLLLATRCLPATAAATTSISVAMTTGVCYYSLLFDDDGKLMLDDARSHLIPVPARRRPLLQ